jgi:hypothetical protein
MVHGLVARPMSGDVRGSRRLCDRQPELCHQSMDDSIDRKMHGQQSLCAIEPWSSHVISIGGTLIRRAGSKVPCRWDNQESVAMLTIAGVVRASVSVLFVASCLLLTGCATHHAKTGSAATSSTTAHATQAQSNPSLPVSFNGERWTFSVRLQAGYLGVYVSARRSVGGGPSTARHLPLT